MPSLNYQQLLQKSIRFGISPKRWLPLFLVDWVFFSIMVFGVLANDSLVQGLLSLHLATLTAAAGGILFLGLVWFLLRLWVTGAIVHQTYRPRDFSKSWTASRERYLSLLGSMIILMIASTIAGMVPFLGQLLSLLVGVVFFFILQSVMIRKRGSLNAATESWNLFMKHRKKTKLNEGTFIAWEVTAVLLGLVAVTLTTMFGFTFTVIISAITIWATLAGFAYLLLYSQIFRSWLIVAAASLVIVSIFALPALILGVAAVTSSTFSLSPSLIEALVLHFLTNPAFLWIVGTLFLIGAAIANTITLAFQTEIYLKLKKHFGVI